MNLKESFLMTHNLRVYKLNQYDTNKSQNLKGIVPVII